MVFGKRTQTESREQFALILNPIRGELQKTRMIERMVRVFPLAIEEANDLIENTPIILLEGLDQTTGEQLRGYFEETGANLILTDDQGFKRRCFRAVWPSPPHVDFFRKIPSFQKTDSSDSPPISPSVEPKPDTALGSEWKETVAQLDGSISQERTTFSPAGDMSYAALPSEETPGVKSLETFDGTSTLTNLEERIASLSSEKEKMQSLIFDLQKENDELKALQHQASEQQKELESFRQKASLFEAERHRLSEELKSQAEALYSAEEQFKRSEEERIFLSQNRQSEEGVLEARFREKEQLFQEEKNRFETELESLRRLAESREIELLQLQEQYQAALHQNRLAEDETRRFKTELASLGVERDEIKRMVAQSQQNVLEQKKTFEMLRLDLEEKLREKNIEIESWRKKSEEWIATRSTLIRELEAMRQQHASEAESFQTKHQEAQAQLEALKRQVREFSGIAEQQDLINKRNRIALQLADKEAKLRELSCRRDMIGQRAKEEQEALDALASERAVLEKDIQNDKQSEKHILEQLKIRDKTRLSILDRIQRAKDRVGPE